MKLKYYSGAQVTSIIEKLPSKEYIEMLNAFAKEPSADVVERKIWKWKIKTINTFALAYGSTGYEPVYECSVCGAVEESYLRLDEPIMPEDADFPNFCPNCGAQMDVRKEDD